MRQITQDAKDAFTLNLPFKRGNTKVVAHIHNPNNLPTELYLHENKIAWKDNDGLFFSMCGYGSPSTRERLQAAGVRVCQRKGLQYYWHSNNDLILIDPEVTYQVLDNGDVLELTEYNPCVLQELK